MLDILDIFELNGEQYKVLGNNDHYVVVNSKNIALVGVSDPADAKERLELLDKYPNFEDISHELSQATLLAFAKKGYATQILLKEGMLKDGDLKCI